MYACLGGSESESLCGSGSGRTRACMRACVVCAFAHLCVECGADMCELLQQLCPHALLHQAQLVTQWREVMLHSGQQVIGLHGQLRPQGGGGGQATSLAQQACRDLGGGGK